MESVTSADGTTIAFERTGSGPPLVLVHGVAGDHTRWDIGGVRAAFADEVTVYAMDRRGRGGSGDTEPYAVEREFEDVAAVVNAIDEPAHLLGHSHGALCALGAALRTDALRSLVLYEPPVPWEIVGPHGFDEEVVSRMERLLDEGNAEEVLVLLFREMLELPPAEVDALHAAPSWQHRVDAAHTIPRELRGPLGYEFDTSDFADLAVPTLLLSGGESPAWAKQATREIADALPNSPIAVLDGEAHLAMNTAPEVFVETVVDFIREAA